MKISKPIKDILSLEAQVKYLIEVVKPPMSTYDDAECKARVTEYVDSMTLKNSSIKFTEYLSGETRLLGGKIVQS